MNNKAQFTLVCTCEIVMRTGETLDSSLGDKPCSDISRIVLCPLHDAAPAMYEALRDLLTFYEWSDSDSPEQIAYDNAMKAIAQAEARS
jgi:hypothetical protein